MSTENGLLVSWPVKGPPLVWCSTNVGAGYSSVAVADGRVFTMGDGADESCVYALDDVKGKLLWKARVGKSGEATDILELAQPPRLIVAWSSH
ncbi:MAG TPA: hypothetical protein VFE51_28890 [Verrucomicrobiae bacterium]|nr:hypothetical protein [Verrucomicrobiae bacterium]